ncbi:MAG: type IX secretion system outer membrane channel protein PorV [Flavobacteriaceae bacterium]|nr:type IX secretion system outer membrane channel protein PorV [Flavobacteriaceae bacterium]MCY4217312.1 type IX secretion system outer membrane channel protein PorV [Flavobacteriaceae bacterium]
MKANRSLFLILIWILGGNLYGQNENDSRIDIAIPFLTITSDAVAGGLGEQGIATPVDMFSQQWNPAKYNYSEFSYGVGSSYTPYLSQLVKDIFLGNINVFGRINDRSIWAASLRYFSWGKFEKTDLIQNTILELGTEHPNELAVDFSYALEMGQDFSLSVTGRFISSDLKIGSDANPNAAISFGADVSGFHQGEWKRWGQNLVLWRYGFRISNLGPKIKYDGRKSRSYFIPTNLGLGGGMDLRLETENTLGFYAELNKLLVPTSNQCNYKNQNCQNIGFLEGITTSFSKPENQFKLISYAIGTAFSFKNQFTLRAGYFGESQIKGPRRYFTVGTGIQRKNLRVDLSYLFVASSVPTPLDNTLRISASWLWD